MQLQGSFFGQLVPSVYCLASLSHILSCSLLQLLRVTVLLEIVVIDDLALSLPRSDHAASVVILAITLSSGVII